MFAHRRPTTEFTRQCAAEGHSITSHEPGIRGSAQRSDPTRSAWRRPSREHRCTRPSAVVGEARQQSPESWAPHGQSRFNPAKSGPKASMLRPGPTPLSATWCQPSAWSFFQSFRATSRSQMRVFSSGVSVVFGCSLPFGVPCRKFLKPYRHGGAAWFPP